jgi:hypothetical protein
MTNPVTWLFDQSPFAPRAACGPGWTHELVFAYQLANLLIFAAYCYIPLVLWKLYQKRRNDFPSTWLLPAFSAFIVFCGLGHLADVVVFYRPSYRLFTLIDFLTAMASWATAIALRGAVDRLIVYPSLSRYEEALVKAAEADATKTRLLEEEHKLREDKRKRIEQLQERVDDLLEQITHLEHRIMTEADYRKLRERLGRLREE